MKKVLFVIHTLQIGGAEKVLINILNNIDKNKYEITVLALVDDGVLVNQVKKIEGIKYIYGFKSYFKKSRENPRHRFYVQAQSIMGRIWKNYLKKMKNSPVELYNRFVKEKYDVEIAFLEGKVAKFVSCSGNPESKKIVWIHTDISKRTNTIFKNEQEEIDCYKKFDKIVCVSEAVKNSFVQKIGISENVYVQINPIDSNEILEKSKDIIEEKLNRNGLIVCTVGRLVVEKGYDRLLEVHKRLMDEGIVHTLWIIGDGKEKKELQEYVKQNKLEGSVNFVGYTNNPYKYIKNADIYVCTSRVEGLSTAVLEATRLEKIIVSTECPGCKEILGDNNENALIVSNDTEGIYMGLKEILTNKDLRTRYEKNIKNRSKLFDLQTVLKQIENIIDE